MANFTGSAKGRKWISKGKTSKLVKPEELDKYFSQGWVLGHLNDTQKSMHKKMIY